MRSVFVGCPEDRSMVGEGKVKDLEMGHGTLYFSAKLRHIGCNENVILG